MKLSKLAILALVPFIFSCEPVNRWLGLDDDNVWEENLEFGIKTKTGVDVDLTPSSPE